MYKTPLEEELEREIKGLQNSLTSLYGQLVAQAHHYEDNAEIHSTSG